MFYNMSLCDVQGRLFMMSANFVVFLLLSHAGDIAPLSNISWFNIVSLYDDHEKKHIWTPTKKVRGRPYMRSGDVPAEGPPEFFLCPGLASTFSLVRAMSVDHSYQFLKMLTILENFTILYTCDKVGKIMKFRRNSEM